LREREHAPDRVAHTARARSGRALLCLDGAAIVLERVLRRGARSHGFEPCLQVAQGRSLERVDPSSPERMRFHEPSPLHRLQVFGHLRLAEFERVGDLAHRARGRVEQLDDAKAIAFGEGHQERFVHAGKYPT
jgi:hypothetical protein